MHDGSYLHNIIHYTISFISSYDNQLLVEYNVECKPDQLAFFNVTFLDIEGEENCRDDKGNQKYVSLMVVCTLESYIILYECQYSCRLPKVF